MRARPRSGEKRGGFGREWRRSEEVEREREAGQRSARGGAARRWEGMGVARRRGEGVESEGADSRVLASFIR